MRASGLAGGACFAAGLAVGSFLSWARYRALIRHRDAARRDDLFAEFAQGCAHLSTAARMYPGSLIPGAQERALRQGLMPAVEKVTAAATSLSMLSGAFSEAVSELPRAVDALIKSVGQPDDIRTAADSELQAVLTLVRRARDESARGALRRRLNPAGVVWRN